jgi:hypothetical protein
MLIVHSSSTCDICLEPFTWALTSATPHVIPCGHVFCSQCVIDQIRHTVQRFSLSFRCLQSVHPSRCPFCRKLYDPQRVKKLHVDPHLPEDEDNAILQTNRLIRRLASASGEDTPEEIVRAAIADASTWLMEHTPASPEQEHHVTHLVSYRIHYL